MQRGPSHRAISMDHSTLVSPRQMMDAWRVEDDAREAIVGIRPADPGLRYSEPIAHGDEIKAERNGAKQVASGAILFVVRRQEFLGLQTALAEGPDIHE